MLATEAPSAAPSRSPRGRLPAANVGANVGAKALLGVLLVHAATHPDLPQYTAKGMGWRLVAYPVAALAVPVAWWLGATLTGARRRYPHLVDLCLVAPFLIDTAGNAANLYDSVSWWDDLMHAVTWAPLVMAFGLAVRASAPRLGVLNLAALVVGFGAVTMVGWEIAEYLTFVADHPTESLSAYRDTIGDMAMSLTGSVAGALAVAGITRREFTP